MADEEASGAPKPRAVKKREGNARFCKGFEPVLREPQWADKLQRLITDYLRNAAKDPARSIPHPFRTLASGTEANRHSRTSPWRITELLLEGE